jgi:hypothetical protein
VALPAAPELVLPAVPAVVDEVVSVVPDPPAPAVVLLEEVGPVWVLVPVLDDVAPPPDPVGVVEPLSLLQWAIANAKLKKTEA